MRWVEAATLRVASLRSSPIAVALLVSVLIVSGAAGIRFAIGGPTEPGPTGEPQELFEDDPEGFAEFLEEGDGSEGAERYVAAEQQLREELAKQAALEQAGDDRALVLRSLGAGAQPWTWLGPRNWGGRTRALAVNPADPRIMLAGGITGGVWRSEDAGASWAPLTDTFSNISIGVLEIDPNNPNIVYAGTGEAYKAPNQHRGNGIMRSTDAGLGWSFIPSTATNSGFDWVGDIEVSPHDSNRIYAATGSGVWLSTDGGNSWGDQPVHPHPAGVGCMELGVRPDSSPDVVFASCGYERDPDGVYRSTDGGQTGTWERVFPADGAEVGYVSIAIAPSNPSIIYASASNTSENAHGLYRSSAGGDAGSWELRASPGSGNLDWLKNCLFPDNNGQGGYDNIVAVDPTNPDRLWVGGIDLFRSEDGGATLRIASDWATDPTASTYVHADQHVIVFDPRYDGSTNRTVYFGNDGGLARTDDDRADLGGSGCNAVDGIAYQSMNQGYGVIQFTGGSVSNDGSVVIGGTQDNGTYRLDQGGSADWIRIQGGDGGNTAIDPTGQWLMASYYDFSFTRLVGAARTGQSATCNNYYASNECADATEGICHGSGRERTCDDGLFYPPLERDPNSDRVLWSGGTRMWRTQDIGSSWASVSDTLSGWASAIAIAPSDSNVVYAGTTSGGLYRTSQGLADDPSWDEIQGVAGEGYVGSIAVDPTDATTAFVAFQSFEGEQLWRSVQGGPWTAIDGRLPDTMFNAVAINPRNPAMVYAGTDVGVFESLDHGDTWRVANENLATTIVNRLVFRAGTSELYVFTFGRGAYKVDVGDRSPPVNDLIASAKEVVLAPDYRDTVDIRSGSSASDDPPLSCGSALLPTQTRSVWYRLSTPTGAAISVSTQGSNFDTVLAVLTRDAAGKFTEVACNDDSVEALGPSSLVFDAAAGTTYFIEVSRSANSKSDTLANTLQLLVTR